MKAYIQSYKNNIPHNHNFYCAYEGFCKMGIETVPFSSYEQLEQASAEDIVVGYVGTVRHRIAGLGIQISDIDYPESLKKYLKRNISMSTINRVNSSPELWPLFVKPVEDKRFNGVVVREPKDLIGCGTYDEDIPVYCSEIIDLAAEWRAFVRYGEMLGIKPYKGDWRIHFDPSVIENAINDYTDAPKGYAMDIGVTDKGETVLIEVNDGYALGSYGLEPILYAQLLEARWAEITGTTDCCLF